MTDVSEFKTLITSNGYRLTAARERTFRLLLHSEPQTMKEIIRRAEGKVDRVSIYRNIELFEQLGIARRVYYGWKYKIELSDKFRSHHHHLVCLSCGAVTDIEDEEHMNEFIQRVSALAEFTPVQHSFDVEGYCSKCSLKR